MATTCENINNSTIYRPDNCGKLSKTNYIQNWAVVSFLLAWVKGFFTFTVYDGKLYNKSIINNVTEVNFRRYSLRFITLV